jgi:hypothetical protein
MLNFEDPWDEDRKRVIVFDQGNNTAFGENLTSTVDDSLSPWGFTRGQFRARRFAMTGRPSI